jgi:cytochrome c-type biogenesis protein CcmH/NrfG
MAADWVLLAVVRNRQRDWDAALEALQQAEKINPFRPDVQGLLAEAYANRGQGERAARHQRAERMLREKIGSR